MVGFFAERFMKLDQIDTSRFLEDPKKHFFIEKLIERSKIFNFKIPRVSHKKALIYLVLMYDKESYFRKSIPNFLQRKYEAGITAGFKLQDNNEFSSETEEVMLGFNDDFNRAVVEYVSIFYNLEYAKLIVYELNYYKIIKDSFTKFDIKGNMKNMLDKMSNEISELEEKIFGGQEAINMRKALYEGTARSRLKLRPEDMIDEFAINKLRHLSPWGDYNLDSANVVKFVGDHVPKE
jgi:hypothetical protein